MSDHLRLNMVKVRPGDLDHIAVAKVEAAAYLAAAGKLREQADQLELLGQNKLRQVESEARIDQRRQILDAAVVLAMEMIDSGFDLEDAILDAAAQAGINSRAIDKWVRSLDRQRSEIDAQERDLLIERELLDGTRQSDIAKKARCSEAHVAVIKKKLKAKTNVLLGSDVPRPASKITTKKSQLVPASEETYTADEIGETFEKTIFAFASRGSTVKEISDFIDKPEDYVLSVLKGSKINLNLA